MCLWKISMNVLSGLQKRLFYPRLLYYQCINRNHTNWLLMIHFDIAYLSPFLFFFVLRIL